MNYNELKRMADEMLNNRLMRENEQKATRQQAVPQQHSGGIIGGIARGKINDYLNQAQEHYQKTQDQVQERYQRLDGYRRSNLQSAWLKPQYQPWEFGPDMNYNEVIPRNNYGEPMYDNRCAECRKHDEERMVCDLCDCNVTYVRVHVTYENTPQMIEAKGNSRNQAMIASKLRKEELAHFCLQAESLLHQILRATL